MRSGEAATQVVASVVAELALLGVIVETALGQRLFGTAPLSAEAWLVPIPFAFAMLALAELLKTVRRRRAARQGLAALRSSSNASA